MTFGNPAGPSSYRKPRKHFAKHPRAEKTSCGRRITSLTRFMDLDNISTGKRDQEDIAERCQRCIKTNDFMLYATRNSSRA